MDPQEIVGVAFGMILIGVPVLAFTARFTLKPLVDAILRLREAGLIGQQQQTVLVDQRINDIQDEMREMRRIVDRLADAEDFHRQLGAGTKQQSLPAGAPLADTMPKERI